MDCTERILALFEDDEVRDFYRRFWYTYRTGDIARIVYTSNADIRVKLELIRELLGSRQDVSLAIYERFKKVCAPPGFFLGDYRFFNSAYRRARALEYACDHLHAAEGEHFIVYELSCTIAHDALTDFEVRRPLQAFETIDDALAAVAKDNRTLDGSRSTWFRIEKWRGGEILSPRRPGGARCYEHGHCVMTFWASADGRVIAFDEERIGELFTWEIYDDTSFDLSPFDVGDTATLRPFGGAPALACRVIASDEAEEYAREAEWFLGKRWWRRGDQRLREGEAALGLCGSATVSHGAPCAFFGLTKQYKEAADRSIRDLFLLPPLNFSITSLRRTP